MSIIQPWDTPERHRDQLENMLSLTSHKPLTGARYVVPESEGWPEGHRDDAVHEVDMGVELIMAGGHTVSFLWLMDGLNEGLAVELHGADPAPSRKSLSSVDVTCRAEWTNFIGETLVNLKTVRNVPNEGAPEAVWSYRLDFSNGRNLVIALGESKEAGLAYMPDALLVIFDNALAGSYRIPASRVSALGE
ncbi:hypothetical protein [Streptomyces cacaoi]